MVKVVNVPACKKMISRSAKLQVVQVQLFPVVARHYATLSKTAPSTITNTETTDPLGLTEDTVSKIYCVPNKETKEVFPRGLPQRFRTQIDCFKNTCWILRAQTHDIISKLRDGVEGQQNSNKFLIHGRDGGGKTICLDQVVHWCWKAGWLVVHVPGVSFWAHSRRELRPSQLFPGTYDQPHEASIWLKNFRAVNAKMLKHIKLSESRTWTKRERSEVGDDLWQVIDQGLRKPVIATDMVGVVIAEILQEQARESGHKLLLAVDEVNGLFNPCAARLNKFEKLDPDQLNLIRYLRKLIPTGNFPGAVVASLSRQKTYRFFSPTTSPTDILGTEGMRSVAGYEFVEVGNFSREEVESILHYFQENKWITRTDPLERIIEEMWHLTEGNPREIIKLSSLL